MGKRRQDAESIAKDAIQTAQGRKADRQRWHEERKPGRKADVERQDGRGAKDAQTGSVKSARPSSGVATSAPARVRTLGRVGAMLLICEEMQAGSTVSQAFVKHAQVLPSRGKFEEWLSTSPSLLAQFRQAQQVRAAHFADELCAIAEAPPRLMNTEHGTRVDTGDVALRSVRIKTHQWLATKLLPSVYGERSTTEHTGDVHVQHTGVVAVMPLDSFAGKLARLSAPIDITPIETKD